MMTKRAIKEQAGRVDSPIPWLLGGVVLRRQVHGWLCASRPGCDEWEVRRGGPTFGLLVNDDEACDQGASWPRRFTHPMAAWRRRASQASAWVVVCESARMR